MTAATGPADPNMPFNSRKKPSRHWKLEPDDVEDCRWLAERVSVSIDLSSVKLQLAMVRRDMHDHAVTLDHLDSLISATTQVRSRNFPAAITSPSSRHEGSIKDFVTPSRHTNTISLRTTKTSTASNLVMETTAGGSSYRETLPATPSKQDDMEKEGSVTKQIRAALTGSSREHSINDSTAKSTQTCDSIRDPPEQDDRKYGINVWQQAIHSQMCIWDEFNDMLLLTGSLASRSSTYSILREGDDTDSEEYRKGPDGDTQIVRNRRIANTEACFDTLMLQDVRTAKVLKKLH